MTHLQEAVAPAEVPDGTWHLRLYIAGESIRSENAVRNLQRICDQYLVGRHSIEIIDLVKSPERARHDQIVAIPTLVRLNPLPVRRIVGDLSHEQRALEGLGLAPST